MVGFPDETRRELWETVRFGLKLAWLGVERLRARARGELVGDLQPAPLELGAERENPIAFDGGALSNAAGPDSSIKSGGSPRRLLLSTEFSSQGCSRLRINTISL